MKWSLLILIGEQFVLISMFGDIVYKLFVVNKSIPIFITNPYHLLDNWAVNGEIAFYIEERVHLRIERSSSFYILPF